jgi:hypothetical protein
MRHLRLVLSAPACAVLLLTWLPATPAGLAGASVAGGGTLDVTDIDGNHFPSAGEFAVSAGLNPDESAHGRITFVFRGSFAAYWGALPGVTDLFRLTGTVDAIAAETDAVVLSGELEETDYADGQGIVFTEERVPFAIALVPGTPAFVMQFCLLPPFEMHVSTGNLMVSGVSSLAQSLGLQAPRRVSTSRPVSCTGRG